MKEQAEARRFLIYDYLRLRIRPHEGAFSKGFIAWVLCHNERLCCDVEWGGVCAALYWRLSKDASEMHWVLRIYEMSLRLGGIPTLEYVFLSLIMVFLSLLIIV